MSQTVKEKKKYTYEDYLKTPDDKRYELIEGELLMTPSPVTKHQRVSRKIEFLLEKFVTENDLGEIFHAPYDVYLDNENVLQPDILFVSRERSHIIGEKNIMWGSDYPHFDGAWPGSADLLAAQFEGVPLADQIRIGRTNAIDFYNLPIETKVEAEAVA